jgi:hypothetical protein
VGVDTGEDTALPLPLAQPYRPPPPEVGSWDRANEDVDISIDILLELIDCTEGVGDGGCELDDICDRLEFEPEVDKVAACLALPISPRNGDMTVLSSPLLFCADAWLFFLGVPGPESAVEAVECFAEDGAP